MLPQNPRASTVIDRVASPRIGEVTASLLLAPTATTGPAFTLTGTPATAPPGAQVFLPVVF
jgi:hypothetical protein